MGTAASSEHIRVIFLDLDGVANNTYHQGIYVCDPKNVAVINDLIAWTQAKVVITSVWRLFHSFQELKDLLAIQGFVGDIIGVTPDNRHVRGSLRGHEIQMWLDATEYKVDRFVILDDDSDMGHLKPHLIRTLHAYGLTSEDARRAARILLDP